MMDEKTRADETAGKPEVRRPDDAIEDLEPDESQSETVTGGALPDNDSAVGHSFGLEFGK
jgi:hypothetical protein